MARRRRLPSAKRVAEWWVAHGDIDLPDEPLRTCWACGGRGSSPSLQRCHVVAVADGGSDHPSNIWLMCPPCHRAQPDGAPESVQRTWLATAERWDARALRCLAPVFDAIRRDGELSHAEVDEFASRDLMAAILKTKANRPVAIAWALYGVLQDCRGVKSGDQTSWL